MRFGVFLTILVALIIATTPFTARAQFDYTKLASDGALRFTFIGNAAFAITDGEMTLMTDYPYAPGANGSMVYDFEATKPKGFVVCLVTHEHKDHFHFRAFIKRSWALIAPHAVVDLLYGYDTHAVEDGQPLEYEGLHILPTATPHIDVEVENYAYLVTWHGVRMYFSGDTDVDRYLLEAQDLDVAFVTPWLLRAIQEKGATIDARKVVVCHHKDGEEVVEYADRVVPAQGDSFEIEYRTAATESQ